MKFENTGVFNLDGAIEGMRFAKDSGARADSYVDYNEISFRAPKFYLGENDKKLAMMLAHANARSHAKYLRQILVAVHITAPLLWWKEADQYKVGTTTNSESTMHTLASKPITIDRFDMDDFVGIGRGNAKLWEIILSICEDLRQAYNETKDMRYWKELIRLLPEAWEQKRHWTGNYEVVRNMYHDRKNHKLTEWNETFVSWVKTLPYAEELIIGTQDIVGENG